MSPDLLFFVGLLLAINGLLYYFAYIAPPYTYASGRHHYWRTGMRATFWAGLFGSIPMLLFLLSVMSLQNRVPDHLRALGLESYPGIKHVAGLPMTPGVSRVADALNQVQVSSDYSEHAYVFELRGSAEEAMAFYRLTQNHGDWELIGDDPMLVFKGNGLRLGIYASEKWDGSVTMIVVVHPDE